jgi:hypothetical protein
LLNVVSIPMTTQTLPLLRRIQVLLNTLVGEHHVRRSLLHEVCELMDSGGRTLEGAREAAAALLAALERDADVDDFDGSVERISRAVERSPLAASASIPPPPRDPHIGV